MNLGKKAKNHKRARNETQFQIPSAEPVARREKQYRFSSNGTVVVRRDNAQERGAVAFDEGTKWPGISGEV